LKRFVDDAYQLACRKLKPVERLMLRFSEQAVSDEVLLEGLIEHHQLQEQRTAIQRLLRPALALTTKKLSDSKLRIGASRNGGSPNLPADFAWPTYEDGRPLTFLAQLNLAEVAAAGSTITALPNAGQLVVFSAWGWVPPGDSSPHIGGH
jgi:hypothetical protein